MLASAPAWSTDVSIKLSKTVCMNNPSPRLTPSVDIYIDVRVCLYVRVHLVQGRYVLIRVYYPSVFGDES